MTCLPVIALHCHLAQLHRLLPTLDHFVRPVEVGVPIPVPGEALGVVCRQTKILVVLLLTAISATNMETVSDMEVS